MQYWIRRTNPETWEQANEQITQEIERGSYVRGGVVYCLIQKIVWDAEQRQTELVRHRNRGMQQAMRRWRLKMGHPVWEEEEDIFSPPEVTELNCRLQHLRTEFVFRHEEWVCLRHMILKNIDQSEEMYQAAFEEVQTLAPLLKSNRMFATKIYFTKQGWVLIVDVTQNEPYM